jgi:hypothetical protein
MLADYPGPTGRFLSNQIGALAEQARVLRAIDPDAHEELAAAAEAEEAAWLAALEAEAQAPGHWEPDAPDMPDLGGWGGHDDGDAARRGWYTCDPDDSTWLN